MRYGKCNEEGVYATAFTPETSAATLLGCAGNDSQLYLYSFDGRPPRNVKPQNNQNMDMGPVLCLAFHHQQQVVAAGCEHEKLWIIDHSSSAVLRQFHLKDSVDHHVRTTDASHTSEPMGCTFLPCSEYTVAASLANGITVVYDMRDKSVVTTLTQERGNFTPVVGLDCAGHNIATGGDDGSVRIYDIRKTDAKIHFGMRHKVDGSRIFTHCDSQQVEMKRVRFSPCERYLGVASSHGTLIIDVDSGAVVEKTPHSHIIFDVAFTEFYGQKFLAAACHSKEMLLMSYDTSMWAQHAWAA